MKQTFSLKTTRTTRRGISSDVSAGPDGIALAPPDYGIDFIDSGLGQAEAGLRSRGG